jgi:hypothetical protein
MYDSRMFNATFNSYQTCMEKEKRCDDIWTDDMTLFFGEIAFIVVVVSLFMRE